jgi:phosphocarrier protein
MAETLVTVRGRAGIHTGPAYQIVKLACKFRSRIFIEWEDVGINAKSILGILTLGLPYKAQITLRAEGEDAEEAVQALRTLIERRFESD